MEIRDFWGVWFIRTLHRAAGSALHFQIPNWIRAAEWLLALGLIGAASGAPPSISSFSPTNGVAGTSVTILGANFTTNAIVHFGFSSSVAVSSFTSTSQLQAAVPADAVTDHITVTTTSGTAVSGATFFAAPQIADFSPTDGVPGVNVVIEGVNFQGAVSVQFGGVSAVNFNAVSPTQINATLPAGAISGPIKVITPVGGAQSSDNFVVTGTEPLITDFSPASGPPGTAITLTGKYFTGASALYFNGTNHATFSVSSPTQIQTTVPFGAVSGLISVVTASGTGVSKTLFTVTSVPVITGIEPASAPPGATVVLQGINFTGATAVKFNGTNAASFQVNSPTQLSAIVPLLATTGPITITTASGTGQSGQSFVVVALPVITDFSPNHGAAGDNIVISGLNFTGATNVFFNTNNALFTVASPTQINAIVPLNATSGAITIASPAGSGVSSGSFTVTAGAPLVSGFSPTAGAPGTSVIISGEDFGGASSVQFNGTNAIFTVTAPTQINAVVPANAISGTVTVTTPFGTGTSVQRFLVAPRLTAISPTNGFAGDLVTIQGANFSDATTVGFNGAPATFTIISSGQITAVVPTNTTTGALSVGTPAGIVASADNFVILPKIDAISPLAGPPGTAVTLSGSGLAAATSVQFGGISASFSVISPNQITAITPPLAVTGTISVFTPFGVAHSTKTFTVGPSADLRLAFVNPVATVMRTAFWTNIVQVTNTGPSEATGVVLTNAIPGHTQISTITTSQGAAQNLGGTLVWQIGILPNHAAAKLTLVLIPTETGPLFLKADVGAVEFDPDLSSNDAQITTSVVPNPTTLAIQPLANHSVVLSWPVSGTNYQVRYSDQLASPIEWLPLTNSPLSSGGTNFLTLPPPTGNRFFQLALP